MAKLFWGQLPIERAAALMFYEPHSEMAQLVYRLKYNDRADIGEDLGRLMAQEMQFGRFFDGIDALIPVPLSRKRLRQRGYNQSEMLAEGVSDITGIPVVRHAVKRKHFVKSQTSLSRQERLENVDGIFYLKNAELIENKHVLLIDDICTTGATLIACGEAMRAASNIRISILTLGFTKK
jgi:ComF family protein